MNIGIDIDGVIFNSQKILMKKAKHYNQTVLKKNIKNVNADSVEKMMDWNNEELKLFFKNNLLDIYNRASLIFNCKKIINKLIINGHKIFLITARGKYFSSEIELTKSILKKNKIIYHEIYFSAYEKGKVCKDLDIDLMIDDLEYNIDNLKKYNIQSIYFNKNKYKNHDSHSTTMTDDNNHSIINTIIDKHSTTMVDINRQNLINTNSNSHQTFMTDDNNHSIMETTNVVPNIISTTIDKQSTTVTDNYRQNLINTTSESHQNIMTDNDTYHAIDTNCIDIVNKHTDIDTKPQISINPNNDDIVNNLNNNDINQPVNSKKRNLANNLHNKINQCITINTWNKIYKYIRTYENKLKLHNV